MMLSSLVLGFPEGNVKNYWNVTGCHLKCPTLCSWKQQSYPGVMWASIEDNHIKRNHSLLRNLRRKSFLSAVQDQCGDGQANWTPCRCPHGPRTFSSGWISLKTSRPMPSTESSSSLPPTHVGRHAPNLEPSALVSSDVRWWVQGQPLPLWSSCLRISPFSWMHQSTSRSTTRRKTQACPLQL